MPIEEIIRKIHATPTLAVCAVTGGGSRAISELLEVPGASRTILEVVVPYCDRSLAEWLGGMPEQACSARTARAIAMAAFRRACRLGDAGQRLAGLACTASLATDRVKRGPHRAHVAIQTADVTATRSLKLRKGHRSRTEEERLVSTLLLNMLAEACGVEPRLELELLGDEEIDESSTVARKPWKDLLLGRVEMVCQGGVANQADAYRKAIFPGAFNPMHVGHRRMVELSQQILGVPVALEISILNVDKPPLDYFEIALRTEQIGSRQAAWLTRAAKFEQKSELFPKATFVVGVDTLGRIADPRYYGGDPAACQAALERIAARGCRFLVFGRQSEESFVSLNELGLPEPLRSTCREVPPELFREDISSTEIRKSGEL